MRDLLHSLALLASLLLGLLLGAQSLTATAHATAVSPAASPALPPGPSMSAAVPDPWALQGTDRPALPDDWRTIHSLYVNVHFHPSDRGVAVMLSRHAATSLPDFANRLAVPTGGLVDIYLAHKQDQFVSLQPGPPPTWADGTAWPLRGMIFLRAPDLRAQTSDSLQTVLDHELVHVLIGRAFRGQRVPRWLQEGVAQVYARQYSSATTDTLASGLLGNNMLRMDDLATGFPADPVQARLAYAQSADLVAWLQNEYGPQAIPTIVHDLSMGSGFGAAMRAATGQRVDQVDQQWRRRLASSGLWLKPLVSDTAMFSVGAL
ncbi:MAG: hypothetical protein GXP62_05110, partial [Oligoflexia bacterium]|nr:hypothetical protein [Oligoflexia bacterium]